MLGFKVGDTLGTKLGLELGSKLGIWDGRAER